MEMVDIEERLACYLRARLAEVEMAGFVKLTGGWEADIYAFGVSPALPGGLSQLILRVFSGDEGRLKESVSSRVSAYCSMPDIRHREWYWRIRMAWRWVDRSSSWNGSQACCWATRW